VPLGGIRDIRPALKRAEVGGILSIEELLHIADFLYVCRKIIKYGKPEGKREPFQVLDPLFEAVRSAPHLEAEINRCVVNDKELADDASPKLRDIRRNVKISNDRIKEQLNSIIHSQTYKNMLQDNVITMRAGRYCVPVKSEYRTSFQGMIHDQSSTGATLFIEPMSVVQLNNKIKELMAEEKAEIDKILLMLSGVVAEHRLVLDANLSVLTHLDFVFAKGELSVSYFGTEPIFNRNGSVNIKKARHPLLAKETVVPTDIYIGKDFTTLLITGPNTGGKTVALKTLGLFTLMGQAGLHIAAFDHSELAVFDNVFADIGDEQSIEQSLSTFSGHMSNIVKILGEVTPDSLVIFDELGAGTDPTEGAALAIAIIESLHRRKIRTAVTTHYSELKVFALSTEGVENAACEFDVETLRPTYRLLIGIPGKSNAFAISKKLGLPEEIIESARTVLSSEDERFEDIITDLEISKKTVMLEKERAEQYRRDAETLKKEFEKQKEKQTQQREKYLTDARNEARAVLEQAKEEAAGIIKTMQTMIQTQTTFKELEEKRQRINEKIADTEQALTELKAPKKVLKPVTKKLKAGDRVFIHSLGQPGVLINAPDANGDMMVQAGIMKIKTNLTNISVDETVQPKPAPQKKAFSGGGSGVKKDKALHISPEIDLRGHMVEEALIKTDKYLDDACLSGLGQVSIIHGKGTGVLRAAIQDHLRRHPHVKSYRLGQFGEGDSGITVVEIK
jgi:DNA mismatch repair protein MutS2